MSQDLFDAFPATSAEQWLEQITRDLKDRIPHALDWSPDGDLVISPFIHADQVDTPMAPLPHFGNWKIGESFNVQDAGQTNHQILNALNGGVESLRIACSFDIQWEALLQNVALPLIHIGLEITGDGQEGLDRFLAYAREQAVLQDLHISVYGKALSAPRNIRFCTVAGTSGQIVGDLTGTLLQALSESDWDQNLLARRDIRLEVGGHYLIEIARIRACRILWQNVAQAMQFDHGPKFVLEARTAQGTDREDPYSDMIRSAFMGTAAVLGGADRIEISPASGDGSSGDFYRHVARNIPQLLRYESKFTEIPDPVAGAYYVDHVTKEIVDRTWQELKAEIKKSGR